MVKALKLFERPQLPYELVFIPFMFIVSWHSLFLFSFTFTMFNPPHQQVFIEYPQYNCAKLTALVKASDFKKLIHEMG